MAVSLAVSLIGCSPLFDIGNEHLAILAFPGIVASMVFSRNIHAFSPIFSLIATWIFWLLVFIAGRALWRRFHHV
jgi:hypothetical protein